MDDERLIHRAQVLAALANPARLLMLEHLEGRDMTVSELTELAGLDMSTVSRHLSVLRQAGIVDCSPEGNRRLYSLKATCVLGFLDCVDDILEEGSGICVSDIRKRMEATR